MLYYSNLEYNRKPTAGLLIGACGTIPTFFEDFRKKFGLPRDLRDDIVLTVLKKSCQILHHHIYNVN